MRIDESELAFVQELYYPKAVKVKPDLRHFAAIESKNPKIKTLILFSQYML